MEKIISRIVEELKKQGLSQTQLAEKAGFTQVRVSRLLNGTTKKIDMVFVKKLYSALGLTWEGEPMEGEKDSSQVDRDLQLLQDKVADAFNLAKAVSEADKHEFMAKVLRMTKALMEEGRKD